MRKIITQYLFVALLLFGWACLWACRYIHNLDNKHLVKIEVLCVGLMAIYVVIVGGVYYNDVMANK